MDKHEHKTIETFDFGITNGSIDQRHDGFHPYVGGCGVGGPSITVDGARKILFSRLKENLNYRVAEETKSLSKLNALLARLEDDPFNLGMFKQPVKSR